MMFPTPEIYYYTACFAFIFSGVICGAVRWFHVCSQYAERELKAMRRKNRPCHLIIVGQGTNRYAVEITADLDNKLRELSLRKEALLYIDTFPNVSEAQLNAVHSSASKERMQKLIEEKNPTYKNWAGRDLPFLLNM